MRIGPLEITIRHKAMQTSFAPILDWRGGWFPIIRESSTGAWQRNEILSTDQVLCNPTLYACITLIASDIAKMRLRLVQQDVNGIWSEATGTGQAFWPVLRKPNHYQNRIEFFEWWILSKLTHGNLYALKRRDDRRVVSALYILDPCRVRPLVAPDGSVFYQLSSDNLSGITETDPLIVPAREMIHDRMPALFHPLLGVSPIFAAGFPALIARNISRNTAKLFENGALPGGVLTAPGMISKETADRVKQYWDENFTGDNAGKVAVLGDGLKYDQMAMRATDAQLIEQLRWSDEQIAKVFHMPPHKVGIGPMPTYNNIQALNLQYYTDCLQNPIEKAELCLDEGLELPRPYGTEFDVDDLLRMDTATLITSEKDAIGIKKINESRRRLGLAPVEGGDTVYLQQQYFSLEALNRRDQTQNPPPSVPPTGSAPAADLAPADEQRAILEWRTKALALGLAA